MRDGSIGSEGTAAASTAALCNTKPSSGMVLHLPKLVEHLPRTLWFGISAATIMTPDVHVVSDFASLSTPQQNMRRRRVTRGDVALLHPYSNWRASGGCLCPYTVHLHVLGNSQHDLVLSQTRQYVPVFPASLSCGTDPTAVLPQATNRNVLARESRMGAHTLTPDCGRRLRCPVLELWPAGNQPDTRCPMLCPLVCCSLGHPPCLSCGQHTTSQIRNRCLCRKLRVFLRPQTLTARAHSEGPLRWTIHPQMEVLKSKVRSGMLKHTVGTGPPLRVRGGRGGEVRKDKARRERAPSGDKPTAPQPVLLSTRL